MTDSLVVDEKLIKEIVGNADAHITDLQVKDFCEAGDNFTGLIKGAKFSVDEGGKKSSYDIVVKSARKMVSSDFDLASMMFSKEINVYKQLLRDMQDWKDKNFGEVDYPLPAPHFYYGSIEDRILALDNLKQYGFKMIDKSRGLDFEKCRLAFETIASFHALTLAYISWYGEEKFLKDSEYIKDFWYEFLTHEFVSQGMLQIHDQSLASVREMLSAAYSEEIDVIEDFISYGNNHFMPKNFTLYCKPSEKFNVICHGDLWVNNLLFKADDEGNCVEIKFLDFQLTKYCTPVADLTYFMSMSGNTDVIVSRQDELLEIYFNCLQRESEKFNVPLNYTFTDLKEEYYGLMDFTLLNCLKSTLFMAAKKEEAHSADDVENTLSDDAVNKIAEKATSLAKNANEYVQDKLINLVRYGRKMNLY